MQHCFIIHQTLKSFVIERPWFDYEKMDKSQTTSAVVIRSTYVLPKVALLDITEQHTMEPGGVNHVLKEETLEPVNIFY